MESSVVVTRGKNLRVDMEKDWREVNKLYDKVLALHFPPGSKQGVVRRLQMGVADLI